MKSLKIVRQKIANFFFYIGHFVQYYEKESPELFNSLRGADMTVYFPVTSSRDYDETTTKVMDAVGDALLDRQWTAGAKLDVWYEE